jgi:hypothetical protein
MGDQFLINLCSPTLAGIKTGNLFTVECDDKDKFYREVSEFNIRLSSKGIRMIPVRFSRGRMLIYLYRPSFLKRDLANEEACKILRQKGYTVANADLCVAELARHLANDSSFPHEIGLFLGYPVRDVLGFMKSPEEGVMYTGFWKVYGDKDEALRTFARYRKCTEVYCRAHKKGRTLEQLTVSC